MIQKNKAIDLYNQGQKELSHGKLQLAERFFLRAIKADPNCYPAHTSISTILFNQGKLSAALKHIEKADLIFPNSPVILSNLGNVLKALGQLDKALTAYKKAISIDNAYQLANSNLAILYLEIGEYESAFDIIKKSINSKLDTVILLFTALDKIPSSETSFKSKFSSFFANAFLDLTTEENWHKSLLNEFRKNDHKSCKIQKFIEYLLNNPIQKNNLSVFAYELVDTLQTIDDCIQSHKFLTARKLISYGDLDKAIILLEEYILKNKDSAAVYGFLIDAYFWNNQFSSANKALNRLNELKPNANTFYKIWLNFQSHEFINAWENYIKLNGINATRGSIPRSSFEDVIQCNELLIYGNQGIGDQVMFLSCLSKFKHIYTGPVTLSVDPRLTSILNRSFKGITLLDQSQPVDLSRYDKKILLEDLCSYVLRDLEDFYPNNAYLSASTEQQKFYKDKLSCLPNKFNVGIAWKGGNKLGSTSLMKSKSSSLIDFLDLLKIEGINWINLQYGDVHEELSAFNEEHKTNIVNFEEVKPLDEIESQMALISQLDLVIQVSNASAHMAGSVGTPVWTLLGNPPDWRWFSGKTQEETPWYGSMKLLRKQEGDSWRDFIKTIEHDVSNFLASREMYP